MELINCSTIDLPGKIFKYRPNVSIRLTLRLCQLSREMARQAGNSKSVDAHFFLHQCDKVVDIRTKMMNLDDYFEKFSKSLSKKISFLGLDFDYNSIMSNSRRAEASMRPTVT